MGRDIAIIVLAFLLGHGIALQQAGTDCARKAGQTVRGYFTDSQDGGGE